MSKKHFCCGVIKYWNRLPREVMHLPCMEMLKPDWTDSSWLSFEHIPCFWKTSADILYRKWQNLNWIKCLLVIYSNCAAERSSCEKMWAWIYWWDAVFGDRVIYLSRFQCDASYKHWFLGRFRIQFIFFKAASFYQRILLYRSCQSSIVYSLFMYNSTTAFCG